MTKRLGTLVLALAAAGLVLAPSALAAAGISGLRVGLDAQVAPPGTLVFPVGTKSVFVRYDYKGAANERTRVVLQSQGGLNLAQSEKRLTGDGTETMEVTGAAIYGNLASGLLDSIQRAQESAAQAVGHQRPTELLQTVQYGILRIRLALDLMQRSNPGKAQVDQIKQLRSGIDTISELVNRTVRMSDSDPSRPALIQQISTQFGPLVAQATALKGSAAQVTDALFPPTGMADGAQHLVQVLVGSNLDPAMSVEFKVARRTTIFTPIVAQRVPLKK